MKRLLILILPISFISSKPKPKIIKVDHLLKMYRNTSDTTYVINFWATWCKPCVEELPDIEKINEKYGKEKVKVILVSMDFPEDYKKKLVPFVQKKQIRCPVVLLDEVDGNYFIPKISEKWTGSIPTTLIVNNAKKFETVYEHKITYELLEQQILSLR